ncbi:MAG: EFR1 family ferrodoxin [Methanobacteriaceae archaeon]|nr:EFR1 family ferrodoxin [Methanobacteriaceae archaeon]
MILYFTGTGNSRYLAEGIAKITEDDEIISINELMKTKKGDSFKSDKPFIFVAPVYAWKIPIVLSDFIKNSKFIGSNEVYLIVNCGSTVGGTYTYAKDDFKEVGFNIKGFAAINMPENYIAIFKAPDEAKADEIIAKGREKIIEIANMIKNNESFFIRTNKFYGKSLSIILNKPFYKFTVSSKGFHTLDNCNGCGKCESLCPLNCIKMVDNRPKWDGECTHCMACICACPNEAIEYKKSSYGKRRYYLKDKF